MHDAERVARFDAQLRVLRSWSPDPGQNPLTLDPAKLASAVRA